MRVYTITMIALFASGSLALAQVCPPTAQGTVCLVPPRTATTTITQAGAVYPTTTLPMTYQTYQTCPTPTATIQFPMASTTGYPMGFSSYPTGFASYPTGYASCPTGLAGYPMGFVAYPMSVMGYPATAQAMGYPSSISPDTASIVNAIAGLRNDVRVVNAQIFATSISLRGQMLTSRINDLMSREMLFRQQLSANPNLPNAQVTATALQAEASALNRDITAFNQELAMVPADQRPYLASSLNTFDTVYWQPTLQAFATYRSQFPQASATYQSAVAANPWLPTWETQYQASINNIASSPQVYASARWWATGPMVLGSVETFPSGTGTMMTLPAGATIYIPPSSMSTMGMGSYGMTGTVVVPSTGTTVMTTPQTYAP